MRLYQVHSMDDGLLCTRATKEGKNVEPTVIPSKSHSVAIFIKSPLSAPCQWESDNQFHFSYIDFLVRRGNPDNQALFGGTDKLQSPPRYNVSVCLSVRPSVRLSGIPKNVDFYLEERSYSARPGLMPPSIRNTKTRRFYTRCTWAGEFFPPS